MKADWERIEDLAAEEYEADDNNFARAIIELRDAAKEHTQGIRELRRESEDLKARLDEHEREIVNLNPGVVFQVMLKGKIRDLYLIAKTIVQDGSNFFSAQQGGIQFYRGI